MVQERRDSGSLVEEERSDVSKPWWGHPIRESGWPLEILRLRRDPIWRGAGVPDGAGRPVLLIPGFMAGDSSLTTMARWLRRRGYRVEMSGISWNVWCADRLLTGLQERIRILSEETGQPISIVGHSRGGLFAHALAGLLPELVAQVVALGSPLVDPFDISVPTEIAVGNARRLEYAFHPESRKRGCFTRECGCSFYEGFRAQESAGAPRVPVTSIVSPDDGVVAPRACLLPEARIIEVRGSHIGLAWNPQVYRVLGDVLAPAP